MNFADTTDIVGVNRDKAAFEARIRAEPEDDTVRLVYADWLDEHADDGAVCPGCAGKGSDKKFMRAIDWWKGKGRPSTVIETCPACKGSGTVQSGFGARAEFIRVQVELARFGDVHYDAQRLAALKQLEKRERELFGRYVMDWFPDLEMVLSPVLVFDLASPTAQALIRRGFVAEVRCPLAVWMGGLCPDQCIDGILGTTQLPCRTCSRSGRIPGIAAAVCGAHPVTVVRLTDQEPYVIGLRENTRYAWHPSDPRAEDAAGYIPDKLHRLLTGWQAHPDCHYCRVYDTPELANAALSTVLIAYGKGEVK